MQECFAVYVTAILIIGVQDLYLYCLNKVSAYVILVYCKHIAHFVTFLNVHRQVCIPETREYLVCTVRVCLFFQVAVVNVRISIVILEYGASKNGLCCIRQGAGRIYAKGCLCTHPAAIRIVCVISGAEFLLCYKIASRVVFVFCNKLI